MFEDPARFGGCVFFFFFGFLVEYLIIYHTSARVMFGFPPMEKGGDSLRSEYKRTKDRHELDVKENNRKAKKICSIMTLDERLKYKTDQANSLRQRKDLRIMVVRHGRWLDESTAETDANEPVRWDAAAKRGADNAFKICMISVRLSDDQEKYSNWLNQIEIEFALRQRIINNNFAEWTDLQERCKIRRQKIISSPQDDLNSPKIDKATLRKKAWDLKIQDEKEFIEKHRNSG